MKKRFPSRDTGAPVTDRKYRLGFRGCLALFLLSLCQAAVLPRAGRAGEDHDRARSLKEAGEILPLEQIVEKARKERAGRLLEAELKEKRGRFIYELEVVDEKGIVWELKYDAKSGALITNKQED